MIKDSAEMGEVMARDFAEEIKQANNEGRSIRAIVPCGPKCWYTPFAPMVNQEKVSGSSTQVNTESAPQAETVEFDFPARAKVKNQEMPAVKVFWYDGGILPRRPNLLPEGENLMADGLGGCIFVGSKDTLITGCGGFSPRLLSGRKPGVTPYLRRVPGAVGYIDGPHEQDWIRACKESPENRIEGTSHFNTQYAKFNALEAANSYIKHTYRDGWSLPAMAI